MDNWDRINDIVHTIAMDSGGSFSAEHGVSELTVNDMGRYAQ